MTTSQLLIYSFTTQSNRRHFAVSQRHLLASTQHGLPGARLPRPTAPEPPRLGPGQIHARIRGGATFRQTRPGLAQDPPDQPDRPEEARQRRRTPRVRQRDHARHPRFRRPSPDRPTLVGRLGRALADAGLLHGDRGGDALARSGEVPVALSRAPGRELQRAAALRGAGPGQRRRAQRQLDGGVAAAGRLQLGGRPRRGAEADRRGEGREGRETPRGVRAPQGDQADGDDDGLWGDPLRRQVADSEAAEGYRGVPEGVGLGGLVVSDVADFRFAQDDVHVDEGDSGLVHGLCEADLVDLWAECGVGDAAGVADRSAVFQA